MAAASHQKAMEGAATPTFVGELHSVRSEEWGAWNEAGRLRRVLLREPGRNLLCLSSGRVLMAEGSPRTAERLSEAGVQVIAIPYDEIQEERRGHPLLTMELVRERAT